MRTNLTNLETTLTIAATSTITTLKTAVTAAATTSTKQLLKYNNSHKTNSSSYINKVRTTSVARRTTAFRQSRCFCQIIFHLFLLSADQTNWILSRGLFKKTVKFKRGNEVWRWSLAKIKKKKQNILPKN